MGLVVLIALRPFHRRTSTVSRTQRNCRPTLAARCQHLERRRPRLSAAGQQVGPTTRSTSAAALAIKPTGAQGRDLRRGLRHRAHAGRQGRAHRRVREPEDHQERLSDAARITAQRYAAELQKQFATSMRSDLARPPRVVARAGRHQAADRSPSTTTPPQVIVSYSPAILVPDRRRAGAEAGARPFDACSA